MLLKTLLSLLLLTPVLTVAQSTTPASPYLSTLATQIDHKLSNLTGQLRALTLDTIPSYHYTYFM